VNCFPIAPCSSKALGFVSWTPAVAGVLVSEAMPLLPEVGFDAIVQLGVYILEVQPISMLLWRAVWSNI
jgi:hypothetical protein